MTRRRVVEKFLQNNPGFSPTLVGKALNLMLEEIICALEKEGVVRIQGLGTFRLDRTAVRKLRGKVYPSRKTVRFKPSKLLLSALKMGTKSNKIKT
ncbi:histone family protein DNA-binding protein [Thermocrinis albus DSM 14484]|uniref:Histone family protein DNA-binding protein n=1 Tax=Thermocrinis albus (strain DSM 14484 / JCM 11386 / HI 11/12) TaxID=638303 RepID=D3SQ95_THEAH|nr:HU family DNA-binding protein [Thermocrinis albus]ADC89332.1 histone family protein DNA-binding protein [Thermocrinis albus DSM 14484]